MELNLIREWPWAISCKTEFIPENDMNVVTTGGSGFGLMAILAGIERGFITRDEAINRYLKILDFLRKPTGSMEHGLTGCMVKLEMWSHSVRKTMEQILWKRLTWSQGLLAYVNILSMDQTGKSTCCQDWHAMERSWLELVYKRWRTCYLLALVTWLWLADE